MGLMGLALLIGIVKKDVIMMIDFWRGWTRLVRAKMPVGSVGP
jgi:hypothetical protein